MGLWPGSSMSPPEAWGSGEERINWTLPHILVSFLASFLASHFGGDNGWGVSMEVECGTWKVDLGVGHR